MTSLAVSVTHVSGATASVSVNALQRVILPTDEAPAMNTARACPDILTTRKGPDGYHGAYVNDSSQYCSQLTYFRGDIVSERSVFETDKD